MKKWSGGIVPPDIHRLKLNSRPMVMQKNTIISLSVILATVVVSVLIYTKTYWEDNFFGLLLGIISVITVIEAFVYFFKKNRNR